MLKLLRHFLNIFLQVCIKRRLQTDKTKDRSQVKKILSIKEGNLLYKKNVLVFDDVITSSNASNNISASRKISP